MFHIIQQRGLKDLVILEEVIKKRVARFETWRFDVCFTDLLL